MKSSILLVVAAVFIAQTFFIMAIAFSFAPTQLVRGTFSPAEMVIINVVAGLSEAAIGYQSAIIFGGRFSMGVGEGVSKVMGSTYVIEEMDEPSNLGQKFVRNSFLLYEPLLIFILTVAIAWDFFTLDSVHAGPFRPIVHLLDIFSLQLGTNTILYSVKITPFIVFFSFLAGIVPSISLPYVRRFKVTGVNSGPFHNMLMISLVGGVAGLSVIFTLLGLFYRVLLLDALPAYYRYALLVAAGLGLCYGVGSYMGLGRAEEMVKGRLAEAKGRGVFEGSVSVVPKNAGAERSFMPSHHELGRLLGQRNGTKTGTDPQGHRAR